MRSVVKSQMRFDVTWVHDEPSPNQIEFFQALGRHPEVRLRVLNLSGSFPARPFPLGSPWVNDEQQSFERTVIPGWALRVGKHRVLYFNARILQEIARSSKDEVWIVGGYTIPTVQLAMWVLTLARRPWILVNEAPLRGGLLRELTRWFLLLPVRLSSLGVLVYGSRKRAQYYARHVTARMVVSTPQYQNLEPLLAIRRDMEPVSRMMLRPISFFYAGRLEAYSGVDVVIRAFNRVAATHPEIVLHILGQGSMKPYLETIVEEDNKSRVIFHGAVSRDQVPRVFALGDVFVHANRGQGWGMVVNEALAAGMPVIASRAVGAAEELIEDGVNGFLLDDPGDEEGFAGKMEFLAGDRGRILDFSANARRTAETLSLDRGVAEFLGILERFIHDRSA